MFIAFEDNLMPTIFDKEFYLSDLELTYLMHWFICDVSQHGSDENEVPLISTHLIGDVTKLCEFASKNKITKTFLVSPSYMNIFSSILGRSTRSKKTSFMRLIASVFFSSRMYSDTTAWILIKRADTMFATLSQSLMANDVRRPKQYEEMLKALCQEDNKVFNTYKDALVFAACLGYQQSKKVEFDKTSEPVGLHIFKGEYDFPIMNCIGLVVTKDPNIMGDNQEDEKIRIFEEYACGGLEIIENRVYKAAGSWEQLIVELVVANDKKPESLIDDITNVFQ